MGGYKEALSFKNACCAAIELLKIFRCAVGVCFV